MKRRRGWWWMVMVDWKGGKEGRKGRWTVANRTPAPLLVAIRPVFPDRSSAAGFDAIAGGIVIGCQMRARPPLNLANLRHHGIGMALGRWDSGNEILRRLETLSVDLSTSSAWRNAAWNLLPCPDHSVQSPAVNFPRLLICRPTDFGRAIITLTIRVASKLWIFFNYCFPTTRSGENRLDENASLTKNNEFRDSSSPRAAASPAATRPGAETRRDQTFARLKTWRRL